MKNPIDNNVDLDITFEGIVFHRNGVINKINKAFTDIFGYKEEEVIGKNVLPILVHEDDIQFAKEKLEKDSEDEYKIRCITKDGKTIYVEIRAKSYKKNGDEFRLAVIRDITETMVRESKLRERVKELNGIYKISEIASESNKSLELIFREIVEIIPPSFQYPDICEAQIEYKEEKFATSGYEDSELNISRVLKVDDSNEGSLTVVYIPKDNNSYDLDFLIEEEKLIAVFVERISKIIERKNAEEELSKRENYFTSLLQTTQDGFWVVNIDGRMIDVNDAYLEMTGYTRAEFLDLFINDLDAKEKPDETRDRIDTIIKEGGMLFETLHRRKDGSIFDVEISLTYSEIDGGKLICFCRDITDKKRLLKEKELTYSLLELLNTEVDIRELMKSVLDFMFDISECEAVGIRLKEGEDYPYFETKGFTERFVKAEKYLCATDLSGQLLRDEIGNPVLDCMCGNILMKRYDPDQSFFTEFGSFVSNGTSQLLANTTEEERQARTRNRCNAEGYESVMLIPLKTSKEVFGLLQFNDKRENRFSNSFVQLMERMAVDIAIAISQRNALKELEISEKDLNESQHFAKLGSWHLDIETNKVRWTNELYEMYGFDPSVPPPPYTEHMKLFRPESWTQLSTALEKARTEGDPYELELETVKKDGTNGWMWVHGEAVRDSSGKILELKGAAQDITDRKNIELRIREKDLEFRKLSRYLPDLIFQFTRRPDGSFYVPIASEGIKNIFGCNPEDVKDDFDAIAKVIHPDDAARVLDNIEYSAKHLTYFTCEFRVILPDIGEQWILSRSNPEKLPDGSITWYGFNANITEMKLANRQLEQNELKYRTLLNNLNAGVVVHWKDTSIEITNKKACELLGLTENQIIGKEAIDPYWRFLRDDGTTMPLEDYPVNIVLRTKEKLSNYVIGINKAEIEELTWVLANGFPKLDENNEIEQVIITFIDITERKMTEEALKKSEEKFRTLAEGMDDYIMRYDKEHRHTYANPATLKVSGLSQKEFLGKTHRELGFDESLCNLWEEKLDNVFRTGNSDRALFEWENAEGKVFLDWKVNPEFDTDGNVVSALAVSRDISKIKNAEKELESINRDLLLAQKIAKVGYWDYDINTHTVNWSDELFKMFGIRKEDGVPIFEDQKKYIHTADWELYFDTVEHTIQTGEPYDIQIRIVHKNNRIVWIRTHGIAIKNADGEVLSLYGVAADITDLKETEGQLKESEALLKKAQQTAHIGHYNLDLLNGSARWSDETFNIFGIDPSEGEPTMESYSKLLHPDDNEELYRRLEKSIRDIEKFDFIYRIKNRNGEYRFVRSIAEVATDGNGKAAKMFGTLQDITEQKLAEEAKREADDRLKNIMLNTSNMFYQHDVKNTLQYVSPQVETILGYTPDEALKKWTEFASDNPVNEEGYKKTIKAIKTGEPQGTYNLELVHKNGKKVWVEVREAPIKKNGKVTSIIGSLLDVSDRKKTEQKLLENEKQLSGAASIARLGPWELEPDKGEFTFTDEFYAVFRTTAEREGGYKMPLEEYAKRFVHPDDAAIVANETQNAIDTDDPDFSQQLDHRIIYADGEIGFISVKYFVVKDGKGRTIKLYGVNQDITEQKKVLLELKESEERYKIFISQVTEGVYRYELKQPMPLELPIEEQIDFLYENLIIAECNSAFMEMYGAKDKKELLGKSQEELHGGKDNPVSRKAMRDFIESGYRVKNLLTEEVDTNGSTKYFSNNAIGIIEHNHLIRMWGTQTDITERRKSEEALNQMQKLESVGSLAGGIAHDFNNLLGGIYGNLELARYKSNEEKVKIYLDKSIESIERAQSLTNQLLTFSKGGEPNKKVEQIKEMIKKTTEFALSGSKIACNYEIKEDLHTCLVDKNQIMQVIENIIINAKHAMPGGGKISVSAENVTVDKNTEINLAPGKYVKIEIEDSGVGISKENLPKIFDPFFTTKPTGNGIGLSAVYSIINKHDGLINVRSIVGQGTIFDIYLPSVDGKAEEQKVEEERFHKGKGTFVVMDDEESIRDSVGEILNTFGYEVVKKKNGEEVLEFFKGELAAGRKVAGMIFDLTIPGAMGGKETIGEIRKLSKETKVFVSSGYTDSDIMAKPLEYGFNGMLRKPFRIKDLGDMLNNNLV